MCAIAGVFNLPKAAENIAIMLHVQQHRAVDCVGVAAANGERLFHERGIGHVRDALTRNMLNALHGMAAIGHIRYATSGNDKEALENAEDADALDDIQPIEGQYGGHQIALAHNGNLTNVEELKRRYPNLRLTSKTDSEYIVRILEREQTGDLVADLARILPTCKGSYSLLIITPNKLIAVRDPSGNRPLSMAMLGTSVFFASETCAFSNVSATYTRDLDPGTIVVVDRSGVNTMSYASPVEKKCRFEGIYVANPASVIFGEDVAMLRMECGRELERLFPVDADYVMDIPDSGKFYAMGFAESGRSGKYFPGILRNHYVGRTFIAATQAQRDEEVAQKFIFAEAHIRGKRLVILDDSLVRGTTLKKMGHELRRMGALEVHGRIGCPPITDPCTYGINTKSKHELVAASKTIEQIRLDLAFDSLQFLPIDSLKRLSGNHSKFCWACMTGEYW